MATQMQLESIKTKTESGNCFCIRVVESIKLRLIVMSTNLEYRERKRQIQRESRRQASEAQRGKERQRELERDFKKGDIFCWKNNMKICSGGEKMRNASCHQGEN